MPRNEKMKAALTAAGGRALAELASSINLDNSSVIIKNIKMSEKQNGDTILLCRKWFNLSRGGVNG